MSDMKLLNSTMTCCHNALNSFLKRMACVFVAAMLFNAPAAATLMPVQADSENATLVFFRTQYMGSALESKININGIEIAKPRGWFYFTFKIRPGTHVLSIESSGLVSDGNKSTRSLTVLAGSIQFYEVYSEGLFNKFTWFAREAPEKEAYKSINTMSLNPVQVTQAALALSNPKTELVVREGKVDESTAQLPAVSALAASPISVLPLPDVKEAKVIEDNRLATEAQLREEARRASEAKSREESRLAAETKLREEALLAAETRAREDARLATQVKQREEARLAAEAKAKEESRLAAETKLREEARIAMENRAREEARLAAQAKLREEARMAAEVKAKEESRLAAQAKLREEARIAAEAQTREAMRLAAQAKERETEETRMAVLREQIERDRLSLIQLERQNNVNNVKSAQQPFRRALVIGNDNYQSVTKLQNAREDARSIAQSLESVGYQVSLELDSTEKGMKQAIRKFKSQVQGGDEVVIFYAGHGVQLGGSNYLIPVDVRGDSEDQIRDEAIQLQRLLDDMNERKARLTLAIVDACRDNPFASNGRVIGGRGLATTAAATGQMVIFSAGTGQQALDKLGPNDKDRNGLFTRIFIREMQRPGITVDSVLRSVRTKVVGLAQSVGHDQVPAIYDQVVGEFFFVR